jgi:O-acetylhomoserine (thiol)-lyase
MKENNYKFDTLKVRAGYNPKDHNYACSVPIYQTASYELGDTQRAARIVGFEEDAWLYTRINNPTVDAFEKRAAALDGASAALALASGAAAVTHTFFILGENGGRILTAPFLYGGTGESFKTIMPRFNVHFDISDNIYNFNEQKLAEEIKPETKAIFIESISNPNGEIADIEKLAEIAHRHNIPLVVDNTIATPYLLNPFKHGADIVIYSATKALTGHGNLIAGIILENGKFSYTKEKFPHFYEKFWTLRDSKNAPRSYFEVFPNAPITGKARMDYLNYFGSALSPFNAYLALLGIETLSERLSKHISNTKKILDFLSKHLKVKNLSHADLPNSPSNSLAKKYFPKGSGYILSFEIDGGLSASEKFIDSLKIFSYLANLGDVKSLVIDPPKVTHGELTEEDAKRAKITPNLIRLSIGLEDTDDLIADLEQALQKA